MSTILDYRGRPVETAALTTEQASPGTGSRTKALVDLDSMTVSRLRRIFAEQDQGEIYDLTAYTANVVRLDGHMGGQVRMRTRGLAALPWVVEPVDSSTDSKRVADDLRELVESPAWLAYVYGLQGSIVGPFAALETLWDTSAKQWRPTAFEARDLRWMVVEPTTGEVRLRRDDGATEELRPFAWSIHRMHDFPGLISRDGLSRALCALRLVKSLGVRAWVEFAEIFGVPFRTIQYPNGADKAKQRQYQKIARDLAMNGWATYPHGAKLEIHEPPSATEGDFHERLISWANEEWSVAVVGQTMTAKDGSSRSQSETHFKMFRSIVTGDGRWALATAKRDVLRPFAELNYGEGALRRVRVSIDTRTIPTLAELVDSVGILVDRGMDVGQDNMRALLPGVEVPAAGEKLLQPKRGGMGG